MNTSRPRTFSINSAFTSPSLKRPTCARPRGTCRCRVISWASAGFALPVNTAMLSESNSSRGDIATAQIKNGWGGRIRTSEWRDQNPLPYHLATPQLNQPVTLRQLVPAQPSSTFPAKASRSGRAPRKPVQLRRHVIQQFVAARTNSQPETHRRRCRSAARSELRQPVECRAHRRIPSPHDRLAIVLTAGREEARNCDGRGISCQFRVIEHLGRADGTFGFKIK